MGWAIAGGAAAGLGSAGGGFWQSAYLMCVVGAATAAGSAAGAAIGRAWGFRHRWIAALACSLAFGTLAWLYVSTGAGRPAS